MALNIFEPRYRLMVRRCMEGNRRFGMAVMEHSHVLHGFACEVEIVECQPQPDGVCHTPTNTLSCTAPVLAGTGQGKAVCRVQKQHSTAKAGCPQGWTLGWDL